MGEKVIVVALTEDEAEHAMARGEHPTNACLLNEWSCELCAAMAAKFRAALGRDRKELEGLVAQAIKAEQSTLSGAWGATPGQLARAALAAIERADQEEGNRG